MRPWLAVLIAIAACKGSKPDKAAAPEPKVVAPAGSASGSGSGTGSAAPAKKQLSREQLAAYRTHMKAGWALQKQQKWAEAVPEFEAAGKAIEGDQRALAELGWSAMNAGDYKKARRADDQAVRVAIDPKVKAAALFNLGMVEAKTGNVDDARTSFTASLALRPNKTVEGELAKLGAAPEAAKPLCTPTEDACECLRKQIDTGYAESPKEYDPPECTPSVLQSKVPVATYKAYDLVDRPWSYTYLLDEHQDLVAVLALGLDRMRVFEDMDLEKAELKTLGTHKVLWIQTKDASSETMPVGDSDDMETSQDVVQRVTLCVVGDDKTPTRCPLRDVPIFVSHDEDKMTSDTHGAQPGHSETKLDLALTDDGTATLKLVSGPSDDRINAAIGPHKLW